MVGVTFQQIQKYENGNTTLNIIKLQQIAKALKLQVPDFFNLSPTKQTKLSNEENMLLQAFRRVKNLEMRGCILKLVININKRVKLD
jgi:transcriptional regulator with XRE-family HTH domain